MALAILAPGRKRFGGVAVSSSTDMATALQRLTVHARDYFSIAVSNLFGLGVTTLSTDADRSTVLRSCISTWYDKYIFSYPSDEPFALDGLYPAQQDCAFLAVAMMRRLS